jgi:hypothetical protein
MLSEFYRHIKMGINFSNDGYLATAVVWRICTVHATVVDVLN